MVQRVAAWLATLAVCAAPPSAYAWGGRLHVDITRAAAEAVAEEMAAWRAYADPLAPHSIDPDLWKETDPAEAPRHYLDAERYRGWAITNLPADFTQAAARIPPRRRPSAGIGPWVAMDVQRRLTHAMQSNDWILAARLAAAESHYVADLHQPLHTTKNFDEAQGPEAGVHLRWEVNMPRYFWHRSMIHAEPAVYLESPWSSLLSWVDEAHARYPEIYEGERQALLRNPDVESLDYYRALWEATHDLFVEQASKAASHLSSLWYTAWVNAGRPTIPPPTEIPSDSFWTEKEEERAATHRDLSMWYFLAGLFAAAVAVIVLSLRAGRSTRRKVRTVVDWKDD